MYPLKYSNKNDPCSPVQPVLLRVLPGDVPELLQELHGLVQVGGDEGGVGPVLEQDVEAADADAVHGWLVQPEAEDVLRKVHGQVKCFIFYSMSPSSDKW